MTKQERVPEEHSAESRRLKRESVLKTLTTDGVLWEYICRLGEGSADRSVLNIIREYDDRKRTDQLRICIAELTERINGGEDEATVRKIVQIIRRSKEKLLDRHQGSIPGTPQSSDSDDEDPGERHKMGEGEETIREYDDRNRTNQLRNCTTELTEGKSGGENEAGATVQTIWRSNEQQLNGHKGSVPGTPQSSEDDDEDPGARRRNGETQRVEWGN